MFKTLLNKSSVNHFVKSISPLFVFNQHNVEQQRFSDNDIAATIYKATTENDQWTMQIYFENKTKSSQEKLHYYPEISVMSYGPTLRTVLSQKANNIADFLQDKYKPDFEKALNIVDIFINKGIESGLINSVEMKKYIPHMNTHFYNDGYFNQLKFKDKNIATVSFNNILQRGRGAQKNYFKKSYINIEVIHLVEPDETIKPYFKIKFPYSAHNKIMCIIPINNPKKMYFAASEVPLKNDFLRKLNSIDVDSQSLTDFFENQFSAEAKNVICETLKMRKSDVNELTIDELKEYFVLVEMIKI
jgi:hypothetical protein